MSAYQSVGCQLPAGRHYRQSVKKIVALVMQNGDSDSDLILEKIRFRSHF